MTLRQTLNSGLVSMLLAGAVSFADNAYAESKYNSKLIAPEYSQEIMPPLSCSRYVRFASKDLFGKKYESADAWNLRYHSKQVVQVGTNTLENLHKEGKLKPGMVVCLYNPKSKYNSRKDEAGNPVKYTHVVLFTGVDKNSGKEELKFAHQFGKNTYLDSLSDITKKGLKPVEVLDSK